MKPNGGSSLDCLFEATSNDSIQTFLNILEQTKLDRVNQLNSIINLPNTISNQRIVQTPTTSYTPQCPSCKNAIKPNDVFCENCGNKLKIKTRTMNCNQCGEEVYTTPSQYTKFCKDCVK
ncbi:MAG: zinc ribbon domain-containing protein [Saprospirales bacterium]|nr:zinc ribbon domain-containing protein [Saprospirales bacterium]